MALRQRRRPRRRAFPVSDTPTQSTDHRSRVGRPTRRIADAYSAVGGALLAAARSALHPRAALVAALGLDSVEKEAAARRTELVDQDGDAALLGANLIKQDQEITPLGSNNLVDPYQALPIGSILVDQDGEAALLGDNNLVKQDRDPTSSTRTTRRRRRSATSASRLREARAAAKSSRRKRRTERPRQSVPISPAASTAPSSLGREHGSPARPVATAPRKPPARIILLRRRSGRGSRTSPSGRRAECAGTSSLVMIECPATPRRGSTLLLTPVASPTPPLLQPVALLVRPGSGITSPPPHRGRGLLFPRRRRRHLRGHHKAHNPLPQALFDRCRIQMM